MVHTAPEQTQRVAAAPVQTGGGRSDMTEHCAAAPNDDAAFFLSPEVES